MVRLLTSQIEAKDIGTRSFVTLTRLDVFLRTIFAHGSTMTRATNSKESYYACTSLHHHYYHNLEEKGQEEI
nr:hypothetical protein [Tanacetum cinerariifolium]